MAREEALQRESGSRPVEKTKGNGATYLAPRVDIYENKEELLLLADLPGVELEGLSVRFDPPELRIEGRQAGVEPPVLFARAFELDERIDPNSIAAELKHGVLRLQLKKSESFKPRTITVRSG